MRTPPRRGKRKQAEGPGPYGMRPLRRPRLALVVSAVLAVGTLTASPSFASPSPGADQASSAGTAIDGLPAVYPTPQSMKPHGSATAVPVTVTVVTGARTDASALSVVDTVLKSAGALRVVTVSDTAPAPKGPLTVYVGEADQAAENGAASAALHSLGIAGPSGLPAGGYVLGTGRGPSGSIAVLDGADATGAYYAAQTLRQLVVHENGGALLPGVSVRDWPSMGTRGVVEGFYGLPWSTADRLSQLDFYGENKMNTYVYTPKNDPYLRAQWRDPYPAAQLATIKQLVDRAAADHVTFTYALSPGLSVCYSSAADLQALVNKFQSLWDIGVRSFAVPLDDISYTTWNCAADQAKWGTGGGAAGQAQAYLLNAVDQQFIAAHPGAQPLETVPTEYYDPNSSPYKTAIAQQLDPDVIVEWTGVGQPTFIPATITGPQAQAEEKLYNHKVLLWDNYPVNDYVTSTLMLGPYVGRDPDLAGNLVGDTANPMIEAEPSKIALFGVADFTWNSTAYDPTRAWNAALEQLGGSNPRTVAALHTFADVNYQAKYLNLPQAPVLSAKIADFWKSWNAGDAAAATQLRSALTELRDAPAVLQATLNDPLFLTEAQPWLQAASAWGDATLTALDMLVAQHDGDGSRAWADRQALPALVAKAGSFSGTNNTGGAVTVSVGQGVLDTFVNNALAANNAWMHTYPPTGQAGMATYENYTPANMVDGSPSTYYWSNGAPSPGAWVGVDLGKVRPVTGIDVVMSKSDSPNDYIHAGTIEYSSDGTTWTSAGSFSNTPEVKATFPAGTSARYVRLVDTGTQSNWVLVKEFTVQSPGELTVTGTPAAASGSSLASAADSNLDSAYRAASAPQPGDVLQVGLPAATPLADVIVAQSGSPTATADVQLDVDGKWVTVGHLTGAYTEIDTHGATATAIRLAWSPGTAAPVINDVVPVPTS